VVATEAATAVPTVPVGPDRASASRSTSPARRRCTGPAETINLGTCADFVKGGSPDGGLQLPGLLGEQIGGQEFSAVNEIREYAGPGTYEKDTLKSAAGVIDISIDNTPYQPTDDTTAQAVINPDGSGSFTFADLKEGEQGNPTSPKGVISGSYAWTCSD
jgi:hypothetical protein